jgi:methyl-accepting chemotaxis protein-1 (serine sensor receptor)
MSNLTIKIKLILTMTAMAVLLIIIGLLGANALQTSNTLIHKAYKIQMPAIIEMGKINELILRARLKMDRAIASPDDAKTPQTVRETEEFLSEADKRWQVLMALPLSPEAKKILGAANTARDKFLAEGFNPMLQNFKSGNIEQAEKIMMKDMAGLFGKYSVQINKLNEFEETVGQETLTDADNSYRLFLWIIFSTILFCIVLVFFSSRWLLGSIIDPINFVIEQFNAMGAGNLSKRINAKSQDEIGKLLRALEEMRSNLSQTVSIVRDGSSSIALSAQEIASGNLDLSSRTENQAASLEETASSMEELTATVQQNAENARQANTLAITASEVASKGGQVVGNVVDTMLSIKTSSGKIVDIIGVIDGIAFQTNILALNAAVEAARAGEQGRGFAVVASEVRSLAQRSASAAKEIKELINDSVNKVDEGSRLVDQAGQTMDQIVVSIRGVADIMAEITAASAEQSDGIAQVNVAIVQMDEVTQQNAALVEEAAAAAGSMEEQASNLNQAVSIFKLESDVKGMGGFAGAKHTNHHANTQAKAKPIVQKVAQKAPQSKTQAKPKSISTTKVERASVKKESHSDEGDWEEF